MWERMSRIVVVAGSAWASAGGAMAQNAANPAALPSPAALLMMIRSHVYAVGLANSADDYEVVLTSGSAGFRKLNTTTALAKSFEALRALHLDLSAVVVTTPVLTKPPLITDGRLYVYGFFPTVPLEVPFGLSFEREAGAWKLSGISVGAQPTGKVASAAPVVDSGAKLMLPPKP